MEWLVGIVFSLLLQVASYLIQPKPKAQKPAEVQDMDMPTADAGRPVPVLFGARKITGVNIIMVADRWHRVYQIKV